MGNKKDTEIYYSLTQMQKTFRLPLAKIKEKLIKSKICRLDGLRAIPKKQYLDSGEVLEFESAYEEGERYYKYQKAMLLEIFKVEKNPELHPINWKEAQKNILQFMDKLNEIIDGEHFYYCHGIPGFEYEIIGLIRGLRENLEKFSKKEQEIIQANLNYLIGSQRCPYGDSLLADIKEEVEKKEVM